jgi:uncharacterized circularly permuted ATP-grasp superfamily protein/uncharacterized alpha-E superfamily protein
MSDDLSKEATAHHDATAAYRCPPDLFDELLDGSGQVRKAYERLLGVLPKMSGPEIYQRWRSAKQSLKDNPPASTGQIVKSGVPQAWELDPIPVVIDPTEWKRLSDGLKQRMVLLDHLLRDVYGSQKFLKTGVLPESLVFGAPSYLRAAMRTEVGAGQRMLYLYAAQIARSASGNWLALADRTQGPSGCGHAVENRLAISRILLDDFQQMHVDRLAGFFSLLRQSLNEATPVKEKNTRTALLTPGIQSQTYFEDAYLARYLGYTLTQTADLTVRGGNVYLKTLGGLVRIDSILRRMADDKCDPLEIDPSVSTGVPGLSHAARERRVLLANSLGTGWGECPGVTAILPQLCQAILGEPLKLQNSPMWWCGDRSNLQFVLANFSEMIVRDAFVRQSAGATRVASLSKTKREQLAAQMRACPWQYVAMQPPQFGCVPSWIHNHIVAWPVTLRLFACAYKERIEVMSGGVARVAEMPSQLDESLVAGSMSKDVWVLSSGPVKPISLLSSGKQSVELKRSPMDLPSRVAEHLFWLGRFAERAECMARHARYCSSQLTSELSSDVLHAHWQVVRALAESSGMDAEPPAEADEKAMQSMRSVVRDFLFDRTKPDGLASAINSLLRNAETIRDRLSLDSWQLISRLDYSVLLPWNARESTLDSLQILNQIVNLLSAFAGLASESMTRGPGWHFMDLGRRIERAQNLLRLLDDLLVPIHRNSRQLLESMLDICDSSMTYRYRYLMSYEIGPVLDLLVVDQSNPRGLAFQFMQIVTHLDALNIGDKTELVKQRKKMADCRASLRLFDPDGLGDCVSQEPTGKLERKMLGEKLAEYRAQLTELAYFVTRRFLTHTSVRQLQEMVNQ